MMMRCIQPLLRLKPSWSFWRYSIKNGKCEEIATWLTQQQEGSNMTSGVDNFLLKYSRKRITERCALVPKSSPQRTLQRFLGWSLMLCISRQQLLSVQWSFRTLIVALVTLMSNTDELHRWAVLGVKSFQGWAGSAALGDPGPTTNTQATKRIQDT